MHRVSIFEFREDLASYINSVATTENSVVIEKRGKPVAMLVPYKKNANDFERYFGFLGGDETGEEFVNRVRRNKRELEHVRKLRNRSRK